MEYMPTSKKPPIQFTARLERATHAMVKRVAKKRGITFNHAINQLLKEHFDGLESKKSA